MSTVAVTTSTVASSPRRKARIAGAVYLITFLTGGASLILGGPLGAAAGLAAGASYVAVTLLFYGLFKPVSRRLSLLAAIVSLAGVVVGVLASLRLLPFQVNSLVFFGFYCLLLAYLISESTFLPRGLAPLLAFAGVGWLVFLSPSLSSRLYPYVLLPGLIGEGALTLWLVVKGVNAERWNEQARTVRHEL
jgi:Domain of unknown function (DUF4386)